MRDELMRKRMPVFVVLVLLAIVLLFFFEWLGSEQQQKWVETPVDLPAEPGPALKKK